LFDHDRISAATQYAAKADERSLTRRFFLRVSAQDVGNVFALTLLWPICTPEGFRVAGALFLDAVTLFGS